MKNLILIIITLLSINIKSQKALYNADVSKINEYKFFRKIVNKNTDLNNYLISDGFKKLNHWEISADGITDSTNIYQLDRNVLVIHFVDCSDSVFRILDYYEFAYDNNIRNYAVDPSQEHLDFNYRKYRITKENQFDIAYLFVPQGQKIYDGKR